MTLERYLRLLRESHHLGDIHITEIDQARLRNLVALEPASACFVRSTQSSEPTSSKPSNSRPIE
jgi:hypothetical protein